MSSVWQAHCPAQFLISTDLLARTVWQFLSAQLLSRRNMATEFFHTDHFFHAHTFFYTP